VPSNYDDKVKELEEYVQSYKVEEEEN